MHLRLAVFFILVLAGAQPSTMAAERPASTYRYTGDISFNIAKVPFSRYGSYLAISQLPNEPNSKILPGVYLQSLHGGHHSVFRIELLVAGSPVPFQIDATPSVLHLRAQGGSVDICMPGYDRIRLRGQGVSLRLIAQGQTLAIPYSDNHWEFNVPLTEKFMSWPIAGGLQVDAPWNGTGNEHVLATFTPAPASHRFEGEIDTYKSVWTPHRVNLDFDASVNVVRSDYREWLDRMPEVPSEFGSGAELAAYVNWASVVAPGGLLLRPAMLMSKNWMDSVWSWDHCFNAMALTYKNPDLAWQQFELPFDHQEMHGALPDSMQDGTMQYSYSKPPIHGWALLWMMQNGGYRDHEHLGQAYEPLARWTDWYFKYRDTNNNGIPEYNHGNDSGWDNSTIMLAGMPVETPDLASLLILQMDALSSVALKLGKEEEARVWHDRSDLLLKQMLDKFWKGDHFVAVRTEDGAVVESDSLIPYIPIVLGKRLPAQVREQLVAGLMKQGRFRTPHGFSTEALASKYYTPDGYWRGPIWAPTSMLLAEGLDGAGEHQIASDIRADFCRMAQKNGMSENFDAVTGTGLRDPAYTWTSSVYLVFAHQLWESQNRPPTQSPLP
jgi:putative isomerase